MEEKKEMNPEVKNSAETENERAVEDSATTVVESEECKSDSLRVEDSPNNVEETVPVDLMKKLEEALKQADEFKNRYLRSVADLENYRRRMLREREDLRKYGAQVLLEELLPALDNMELGLRSVGEKDADNPVSQGFSMVNQQIKSIFSNNGVKELTPVGETFDPNFHDCVAHIPSNDFEENTITAMTRKGYMLYDRLIRPASVVVSSGPATEKEEA